MAITFPMPARAQVGGLGMAAGRHIGDGFWLLRGDARDGAKVRDKGCDQSEFPCCWSGVMMFDFMGWKEAGQLIERGSKRTIAQKRVTYDLSE